MSPHDEFLRFLNGEIKGKKQIRDIIEKVLDIITDRIVP